MCEQRGNTHVCDKTGSERAIRSLVALDGPLKENNSLAHRTKTGSNALLALLVSPLVPASLTTGNGQHTHTLCV